MLRDVENNLTNLKKRILLKNENLSNINKTSMKFNNKQIMMYNYELYNISSDSSSSNTSETSSDTEDIPEVFKSNKSTSLSLYSARNPKTSEMLDLDGTSVRDIMENFGMSKI